MEAGAKVKTQSNTTSWLSDNASSAYLLFFNFLFILYSSHSSPPTFNYFFAATWALQSLVSRVSSFLSTFLKKGLSSPIRA